MKRPCFIEKFSVKSSTSTREIGNLPEDYSCKNTIKKHTADFQRLNNELVKCRRRIHAIEDASPWPLSKDWEIRVDEANFDQPPDRGGGRVYFCNHKEQRTTFEVPPPPEPGEKQFSPTSMPEYRALMGTIVKLVEQCFTIKTQLERCTIVKGSIDSGANHDLCSM